MNIKIFVFFFTVFMVQITIVKSWATLPSKATRKYLNDKDKNEFKNTIKEFLDDLTFGHFWKFRVWEKKSNGKDFHTCMNDNSGPYNNGLYDFKNDALKYLTTYKDKSYYEYKYLIDEIKEFVSDICNLLEEIRSKFYLETQKKSFEDELKRFRKEKKEKVEEKLVAIHQNMKNIQYFIRLDDQISDFNYYQKKLNEDFQNVGVKTVDFYKNIKKCMEN